MDNDDQWKALQASSILHTMTIRYPKPFLTAIALASNRVEEYPSAQTKAEAEQYLRDVVKTNIEEVTATYLESIRPKMKARVRRI